jgi:hypothetical protein
MPDYLLDLDDAFRPAAKQDVCEVINKAVVNRSGGRPVGCQVRWGAPAAYPLPPSGTF